MRRSAVDLIRTRGELAALEFDEARELGKDRLTLLVVGVVCFAIGTVRASAFVVVLFWDSTALRRSASSRSRIFSPGRSRLWRFSVRRRTDPKPFAATLAELERDREWLAGWEA